MHMQMNKGDLITFDSIGRGMRIRCAIGKVWITQEGDSRDYLLGTGQVIELRLRGRVAITALDESLCVPEFLTRGVPSLKVSHACN
ncbi:MAG: hypothetical protein C0624_09020 [Desulfuromonas sp.]|nr:MAG: hypothetical protein C0624_09020 [Desulfuromonas sp.]